jgi:hypothetical protein
MPKLFAAASGRWRGRMRESIFTQDSTRERNALDTANVLRDVRIFGRPRTR